MHPRDRELKNQLALAFLSNIPFECNRTEKLDPGISKEFLESIAKSPIQDSFDGLAINAAVNITNPENGDEIYDGFSTSSSDESTGRKAIRDTDGQRRPRKAPTTVIKSSMKDSKSREIYADLLGSSVLCYTASGGSLVHVSSMLRYSDERSRNKRKITNKRLLIPLDGLFNKKAGSYAHLLNSSTTWEDYDPMFLDDPDLRTGKHRTIITLPSLMGSVIPYFRPLDLKRELNEKFRQKHPDLDPSITLSQIRKVKQLLIHVAVDANLELSSVAKAFAYFEKLLIKKLIAKYNRKLMAAVCLLLAVKINDSKDVDYNIVLSLLSKYLEVSTKDIRDMEFSVFAALDFSLHIKQEHYIPHFERIFNFSDFSNIQEYLGERMYQIWLQNFG